MHDWEYAVLLILVIAIYFSLWRLSKTENSVGSLLRTYWEKKLIQVWVFLISAVIFIGFAVLCIIYFYILNYLPSLIFTLIAPGAYFFLRHQRRQILAYTSSGAEAILRKEVGKGGLVAGVIIAQFFLNFFFSLALYGILVLVNELLKNRTFSKITTPADKIQSEKYVEKIQTKFDQLKKEGVVDPVLYPAESIDPSVNYEEFEPYEAEIEERCAICHQPVKEGKAHHCKNCATPFHKSCVLTWIQNREADDRFCPVCHGNLGYI